MTDTCHADDILSQLLRWRHEEILQRLKAYRERTGSEIDVLSGIVELDTIDLGGLYSGLVQTYGVRELAEFLTSVFGGDRLGTESIESVYATSLCYLLLIKHLASDLQNLGGLQLRELGESVLSCIVRSNLPFWPELLVEILSPLFPRDKLVKKAKELSKSKNNHHSFIGKNLLYGLAK